MSKGERVEIRQVEKLIFSSVSIIRAFDYKIKEKGIERGQDFNQIMKTINTLDYISNSQPSVGNQLELQNDYFSLKVIEINKSQKSLKV